jgi:hypothetical protein
MEFRERTKGAGFATERALYLKLHRKKLKLSQIDK